MTQQTIVGFHQDALGDWVAELDCGHHQHVRHRPPWTQRPWVVTAEGRAAARGAALACRLCDQGAPRSLAGPPDAVAPVVVRPLQPVDLDGAFELLTQQGWGHRLRTVDALARLVAASQRVVVAVSGDEVVGFLRAITDGLSNGHVSMVVVAPGHRRRGIGRRLVGHALGDDPQITWTLNAGRPGASDFFASLGFAPAAHAMERRRVDGGGAGTSS